MPDPAADEMSRLRLLLVADTHLGFDLPFEPRIQRRRRGVDFFANFERALQFALENQVDLVVHGGDLLYRTRVPAVLVEMALAPLIRVARQGIPVYLVPGNHERSRIPLQLWTTHENLHIFDRARTFLFHKPGLRVALAGFPFMRQGGEVFGRQVASCAYPPLGADINLLCTHLAYEGARVGAQNYTFRPGPEVVAGADLPSDCAAVLSGHIHRSQQLTHDLRGKRLPTPVIYPGSVERTSYAERLEPKHFAVLTLEAGPAGGRLVDVEFQPLPARPMLMLEVPAQGLGMAGLSSRLHTAFAGLDPEAIVDVRLTGELSAEVERMMSAAQLRALAPPTMNVTWRPDLRG